MSRPVTIATHSQAGRVEPHRLAIRLAARRDEANEIETAGAPIEGSGQSAGAQRIGPIELRVGIESHGDVAKIAVEVHNHSDAPTDLAGVIVGLVWTGHGLASYRFLRHGWQSWSFTGTRDLDHAGEREFPSGPWLRGMHHGVGAVPEDRRAWHESDLVTVVGAAGAGPLCLVGALERGRSFGVVYLRREGERLHVEVELRVDARLAPGESRELECIRVALGNDASRLLEQYAEALGREMNARTAHPFLSGWCSWYHFFHDVTEQDVLRNLDALTAARDELPVDVIQLDDGYQRAVGDWLETNEKFPRGLAPLAADIRAAGFTAGLWTAPFCVVSESRLFEERGDWLLRRGENPFRGLLHPNWSEDAAVYVLDTGRPEVVAHLEAVFRELVEMGFSYLKLDFLYTAAMQADGADPGVGRAERLRRGLEAVRAGAGEEAFLLGCGCPLGAAVGIVDGMRIGPDVAPRWRALPEQVIPGLEETAPSTRSAVRSILARAFGHRRLWLNDPDCLIARSGDTGLCRAERETLAAAIGITGGMAFFSDDVPALVAEDRALIRETVEAARCVDALGIPGLTTLPDPLASEIADFAVATGSERSYAALINTADAPVPRSVELASLGLSSLAAPLEALLGPTPVLNADGETIEVELGDHASSLVLARRDFSLAVFCDFDGTFSVQDVGSTLAIRHAGERRKVVWERYARGEIQAWECNLEILDGLALPLSDVEAFLQTVDLDPGARDLVDWCGERGVPFRVLSDGFDYNLNRLQVIHAIRFAFEANRLRFDRGRWRISAAGPDPACGCGTGLCKRKYIDAFRERCPGVTTVHIGNGRVSDTCGAEAADVAFAKDTLAAELDARGEPYELFEDLRDVIPRLEKLLTTSRLERR